MQNILEKYSEVKKKIISILPSVFFIIPYIYATRYALPSADDFSFAWRIRKLMGENMSIFEAIVSRIKTIYFSSGGRWLDEVVITLVLRDHLDITIMHIYLIVVNILFFVAIYFFMDSCIKFFFEDTKYVSYLFFASVLIGLNLSSPDEVFYWVAGSAGYMVPFIIALFAVIMWTHYVETQKLKYLIISSVLSFICTGGSQIIAGFINCVLLGFLITYFVRLGNSRRETIKSSIPFIFSFIGALVNVLAPGTYVRHTMISPDGFDLFLCIFNTFKVTLWRIYTLTCCSYFIVVFILLFFAVRFFPIKIKLKIHPICIFAFTFITGCISYFPYILGYHANYTYVEHRVLYMIDWIITIFFLLSSLYLAVWLEFKFRQEQSQKDIVMWSAIVLGFTFLTTGMIGINNLFMYTTITELSSGNVRNVYTEEMNLLESIEISSHSDVVVAPLTYHSELIKEIGINESGGWINSAISDYYGKNSVNVSSKEEL